MDSMDVFGENLQGKKEDLDLFRQKEYLLQLYQVMHPEDRSTTKNDLRYVTINRVLLRGIYNDLGFMAGDKLMILVEAQSTWTRKIKSPNKHVITAYKKGAQSLWNN